MTKGISSSAFLMMLMSVPAFPQDAIQTDLSSVDLLKKVRPAVVFIKVLTDSGGQTGSGFIVDKSGTIVTNLHVVRDSKEVAVRLANGDVFEMELFRVVGSGMPLPFEEQTFAIPELAMKLIQDSTEDKVAVIRAKRG